MFGQIKYGTNTCDHKYSELVIHLTKACDNRCSFCIAKEFYGVKAQEPNIEKIKEVIYTWKEYLDYITIGGGEPLLYINEVNELIDYIHENTKAKVIIITSVPKICYDNKELFFKIIEKTDRFQISGLHNDIKIGDKIRGTKSKYDRNSFYSEFPNKENIIVNINCLIKYLETSEQIVNCVNGFWNIGFKQFRLVEIKDHPEMFVDIAKTLKVKLKSMFAYGCHQEINFKRFIPNFDGTVTICGSCFLRDKNKKASIWDLIKAATRPLFSKQHFFGVVYENGELYNYWK